MLNPRLASRYAKSLLDMAVEQNSVEDTLKDMQMLDGACRQSREFANILRSPVIKADKKTAILKAVFNNRIGTLTTIFINLLLTKSREASLPEIAGAFILQYNQLKNIKTVKLTTAVAIDDTVKAAILKKIADGMPDSSIQVETKVNPDLIGGFVLEMEDKLFDVSVRRDLKDIRSQFMDDSYISKLN